MAIPGEVGLRLVLSPFGSNVVVKTACCSIGTILPVYSTFKAVEKKDQNEQQKWLLYWSVYGSFTVAEVFADKILSWFPLYYHAKFAFLVWLQLPSANGANQLYMSHLRPFLLRHQASLDKIVDGIYRELSKFVSSHESEIQYAKKLLLKIKSSATPFVHDFITPEQSEDDGFIEGPSRDIPDTQTADNDY